MLGDFPFYLTLSEERMSVNRNITKFYNIICPKNRDFLAISFGKVGAWTLQNLEFLINLGLSFGNVYEFLTNLFQFPQKTLFSQDTGTFDLKIAPQISDFFSFFYQKHA